MRHRRIHRHRHFSEINVTPLIDVVMCLIIFYLMVGKLATDRKAQIKLPESAIGAEADPDVVVVNILAGDASKPSWPAPGASVVIGRDTLPSAEALESAVRERLKLRPQAVVQIRAARDLDWGKVSPVMRTCTRAGAATVRLAAERTSGGSR